MLLLLLKYLSIVVQFAGVYVLIILHFHLSRILDQDLPLPQGSLSDWIKVILEITVFDCIMHSHFPKYFHKKFGSVMYMMIYKNCPSWKVLLFVCKSGNISSAELGMTVRTYSPAVHSRV
jgi:hypothetical protein